jgi:hypothetical protein
MSEETKTFQDWLRFQNYAKNHGFDSLKFTALFPAGAKQCKWLDAYFGFFQIDGIEGALTVQQMEESYPDVLCIVNPEN